MVDQLGEPNANSRSNPCPNPPVGEFLSRGGGPLGWDHDDFSKESHYAGEYR